MNHLQISETKIKSIQALGLDLSHTLTSQDSAGVSGRVGAVATSWKAEYSPWKWRDHNPPLSSACAKQ